MTVTDDDLRQEVSNLGDEVEELRDVVTVLARHQTSTGERVPLDDVLAKAGLTREQVEAAED